ncbi:WhiB family transcriptional regulator [Streptomyces sp. NPDC002886]|uniref:WhiB family transcriptional regulator n=1 Tax=Streptomyces sp. NPDC002886 TaxID=3364667 RepID=UPI0036C33C91
MNRARGCSSTPGVSGVRTANGATRRRKRCALWPVQRDCLRDALKVAEPFGIWGGLTERERRGLRTGEAEQSALPSTA